MSAREGRPFGVNEGRDLARQGGGVECIVFLEERNGFGIDFLVADAVGDVIGAKTGQTGPFRIDAVAVRAVAGPAGNGLGGAGLDIAGRKSGCIENGTGNCCCKNPNPLHDPLLPLI